MDASFKSNIKLDVARQSRLARAIATAVLAGLLFAIGVEAVAELRGGPAAQPLVHLAWRLPMLFYLFALWTVRRAFTELAGGAMFAAVVPRLLARVGWALAAGGAAQVVATPWLLRALAGRGAFLFFDPAAITLGVVGLLLVVLAGLLARGAAMQAELDGFL
jgi:hypothetical protein